MDHHQQQPHQDLHFHHHHQFITEPLKIRVVEVVVEPQNLRESTSLCKEKEITKKKDNTRFLLKEAAKLEVVMGNDPAAAQS